MGSKTVESAQLWHSTRRQLRKSPHTPAHGRPVVQFGGFKLVLGQIISQTELLIFLILGWGADIDLVVSRVGKDIVVVSIPLHQRHFVWRKCLELFLPLGSGSDDGSEACRGEQVLCVCVLAQPIARLEGRSADKIESGK